MCIPTAPNTTTYDHILAHLTAINNPHTATVPTDPVPESTPNSPATNTSTSPSSNSWDAESTEDTQSTSSENSISPTIVTDNYVQDT